MAKDEMVFITKEPAGHLELTNDTGADLKKGDFCVVMGFAGVADQSIAAGETGSFAVADGLLIQADNFVSGQDAFTLENENVYWNKTPSLQLATVNFPTRKPTAISKLESWSRRKKAE